jgi:phage terminase large subunit GpA-like protein
LLDEVDRYPLVAKNEGSPIDIVKRRTANFHDSSFICVSTPTTEDDSKIYELFLSGTQSYWNIKCIHCQDYFYPEWKHVNWLDDQPETAKIVCPICGGLHDDNDRLVASQNGKYVAKFPERLKKSFHSNALVSPWAKLKEMVEEFIACDNQPSKLAPFKNTVLGLPYKYVGESVGDLTVSQRVKDYSINNIPNAVILLTAGADVQGDRIECEVLGHTADGRTYSIDYMVVNGDTKDLATFEEWKELLFVNNEYVREDGIRLYPSSTLIDSGYNTKIVYAFCERNKRLKINASKGIAGPRAMIAYSRSPYGASFYKVGVDIFKEQIYNNLQISDENKEGYCFFPHGRDQDYFIQLCQSETRVSTVDNRGQRYFHYVKKNKNMPNEALDCRVYAMAAYEIIRPQARRDAEYIIKKQQIVIENMQKDTEIGVKDAINEEIYKERATINKLLPSVSKYAAWSNNVKRI